MRVILGCASALALLSACGQHPEVSAEVAAPEAAAPASAGAGAGPSCPASALPVTGMCSDANPSLFIKIDTKRETFARGCVWRTEEVKLSDAEALLFRAQDCTGERWDAQVYSVVDRYVKIRPAPLAESDGNFMVEIFPVGDGQTAEQVALQTLVNAPEDQRARCIAQPLDGFEAVGRVFEIAPNDELTREMTEKSPDEPWDACGPNGVTMDAIQYWEGRDRHALFHMTGQDDPMWDPASFTFYVRNPDGSWSGKD